MRKLIHPLLRCVLIAVASSASHAWAQAWPQIKAPQGAHLETIASDMLLNGMPCRIFRFQARGTDTDALTFYRAEFGAKRVVENRVKGDSVIATRQGDFFVTVNLHRVDSQTVEGTVMTTSTANKPSSSAVLVDTKGMLPSDTLVVSTVQTNDAGKRSLIVVGVNRNSVDANRDHVLDAMAQRGFRLTRQEAGREDASPSSVSLQLSSPAEEATVTVSDAGPRRSVVINRIREAK